MLCFDKLPGWTVANVPNNVLPTVPFQALTPIIADISRVVPTVVAVELMEDDEIDVDTTVEPQAVRQTQEAWSSEVINQSSIATA